MNHDFIVSPSFNVTNGRASAANDGLTAVMSAWCVWMFRLSQCGTFARVGRDEESTLVHRGDCASDVVQRVGALIESGPVDIVATSSELAGTKLRVEASGSIFRCQLRAAEGLSSARVAGLAHQLSTLSSAIVDAPTLDIEVLPLLSVARQRECVERWRGPTVATEFYPLAHVIERHARERPDVVAVKSQSDSLTYAQLDARANQVARWLREAGVQPGTPVAVSMDSCVEFLPAMLGVWKAGAIHVPVEPTYPATRIAAILEDIKPTASIVHAQRAEQLAEHEAGQLLILGGEDDPLAACSAEPIQHELSADDTAYIIYTSGTTGKPKGVMISQASLTHYIEVARQEYGYCETDVIPAMARFSFSITFFELLCPLTSGGCLRILSRDEVLDHAHMVGVLRQCTCIHASPSWWRKIIAHIDDQGHMPETFANLRHVSSGGDMVPPDVLESLKRIFTEAEVFVIYGCSEISCMGVSYEVPRDRFVEQTRVGRAFPNMSVRVVDAAENVVPQGFVGEVYFGGAGLASGYLDAPQLSAKKFAPCDGERLYRTGDLGIIDDDGNLQLLGRSDFQIKLRGFRIEPAEIEVALRKMTGVEDAIVSAAVVEAGDKRLVAHVVLSADNPPSARAMREFLGGLVPDYMVPAHFVVLDALPLNHNGKVDRRALPAFTLPSAAQGSGDPPRTTHESQLLDVWRSVMKVPGLGIHDDFFELGGDSLRGAELMTQIDHTLGVALPVSALLRHPTVAELAPLLGESVQAQTESSAVVCLRPGNARPAIFFIHDGEGETIIYRNLAQEIAPGCPVYGIHPKRSGHHAILHTRIGEMVEYYADEIRRTCSGPYVVGGLCIGGFLAFEVARTLRAAGASVPLVALLDSAHVAAPLKGASSRRLNSLGQSLGGLGSGGLATRVVQGASVVAKKAYNTAAYELSSRLQRKQTALKIRGLRYCLDHGLAIPASLRDVGVDATLRFAEKEFVVPEPYDGPVVLFRATTADPSFEGTWIDDRPYSEFVDDPEMGWGGKASDLRTEYVSAGHSSMLQAANVSELAQGIDAALGRVNAGPSGDAHRQPHASGNLHADSTQAITELADGASLLVVIVSYRTTDLVVESLQALKPERALHPEMRVVVVDNTCGEDAPGISAAIAEHGFGSWAMVHVAEKNGGYAYGNNLAVRAGLRAAKPPAHFWLLNPDTQVCSNSSRALVEFFADNPGVGIAGSCLVDPDGTEWGRAFRFPSLLGEFEEAMHLWPVSRLLSRHVVARKMGSEAQEVDWLSGASLMIRKEVFEAVGLFDEGYFLYYEETDFCLAAQQAGWSIWYVPTSKVMHIAGQSTGVTARGGPPKRIPDYVFDSRRRYFVKNHGWGYAALTDLAKIGALAGYRVRRALQRKDDPDPPQLLWDSVRGSAFVRGPRRIPRQRNE